MGKEVAESLISFLLVEVEVGVMWCKIGSEFIPCEHTQKSVRWRRRRPGKRDGWRQDQPTTIETGPPCRKQSHLHQLERHPAKLAYLRKWIFSSSSHYFKRSTIKLLHAAFTFNLNLQKKKKKQLELKHREVYLLRQIPSVLAKSWGSSILIWTDSQERTKSSPPLHLLQESS